GRLKYAIGVDGDFYKRALYVEMGEWGCGPKGAVLAATGASPCLNVVVHNTKTDDGGIAHVPHSTPDQAAPYNKPLQTIIRMVNNLGGAQYEYDIGLGSGKAFHAGSGMAPWNPVRQDFKPWLEEHLLKVGVKCGEIVDLRIADGYTPDYDSGNLVYRTD